MACLRPATGTNAVVYYIKEVDCGVTPETPNWKPLRTTGGIPTLARESLTSEELDGSREINGFRLGQYNPSGDINFELSYGSHDDILAGGMQSTWVAGNTEASVTITVNAVAKTFTRSAGDFTAELAVGDLVKFPSLSATNIGPFIITTLTATVATFAGASGLVNQTSVVTSVVEGDKLSIGSTDASYSLLVHYTDLNSGVGGYDIIKGCHIGAMNFAIAVNAYVTGTFSLIGKDYIANAALPAGSTFSAATTAKAFASFDGQILQDGAVLGFVTSISPATDNAGEAVYEIGTRGPSHISFAKVNNTFSIESFFYNYTLFEKFVNETKSSLTAMLKLDGKAMSFSWPEFYYTEGAPDVAGPGDISLNLTGQAVRETGTSSLIIQRIA